MAGKVVPTWNYAVVHAHCTLQATRDPAQLLQHIVGIELTIHRLHGKWKVSQNQPEVNQRSVIAGLQGQGTEGCVRMAEIVAGQRSIL